MVQNFGQLKTEIKDSGSRNEIHENKNLFIIGHITKHTLKF